MELETAFIAVINFGECAALVIAEPSIFLMPTWSKMEENKAQEQSHHAKHKACKS